MKKCLVILGLIICLSSCSRKIVYVPIHESDTITVTETLHDTIIKYPLPVEKIVNVTLDTISNIETSLAKSTAIVDNGILKHTLENKQDSLPVRVEVKEIEKTIIKEKEVPVEVPVEVEKKVKPWYLKHLIIFSLCSGIYFILKIAKFIQKWK